jgi:hypothetical protein
LLTSQLARPEQLEEHGQDRVLVPHRDIPGLPRNKEATDDDFLSVVPHMTHLISAKFRSFSGKCHNFLRLVTGFVARKMVENNMDVYNYLCGDGGVGGLLHFFNIFVSKLCGMRAVIIVHRVVRLGW